MNLKNHVYPLVGDLLLSHITREHLDMSAEEIEKFLTANKDDSNYWLFVVAMNTGMRRGELAGLLWGLAKTLGSRPI